MDQISELITRGVEQIYPNRDVFEKVLRSGKKLRLYQGFDPSMPSLHLGNFVGLMKLRQFQKLGHEVIFLVGDFTGMIGDPTDKLATRKQLTREQVTTNCQTWQEQAGRVLDFSGTNPVKILYNSAWSDKLSFKDLIEITANFTVQQMLERDMFQIRLKEGKPIHLSEFLYPVAQAIDCVEMDVDLEIGGSDQTFNMLAGRTLMKALKNKEKYVLTTKLLVDSKGDKVGKTTGNALFLDSAPDQFFGGIMSFPDEVIELSFELLTECPLEGLSAKIKADPMGEKKRLAFEVVKILWGSTAAINAQSYFENTFQKGNLPDNIPTLIINDVTIPLVDLLATTKVISSKSEGKRLLTNGAIELNGKPINPQLLPSKLANDDVIKIGKTRYFRLKLR